ncbi:hypothetical protein FXO38_17762 [Capsicum annuum]|nr:hypothetical protein FXO38_17762 [Capsicum annuum]KAF3671238.1 hypothetical protein FXO37_08147 [Capsicum annuum]
MTNTMDKRVGVCRESGQRSEEPHDFAVTRGKERTINSNCGTWADRLEETRQGPSYSNISEKGKGQLYDSDSLALLLKPREGHVESSIAMEKGLWIKKDK